MPAKKDIFRYNVNFDRLTELMKDKKMMEVLDLIEKSGATKKKLEEYEKKKKCHEMIEKGDSLRFIERQTDMNYETLRRRKMQY